MKNASFFSGIASKWAKSFVTLYKFLNEKYGICLLQQTASGAQSETSPSKIEEFREFEVDLSALVCK